MVNEAQLKFRKGQRVRLSPAGLAANLRSCNHADIGVVTGFSWKSPACLGVRFSSKDGAGSHTYHMDFIEPAEGA